MKNFDHAVHASTPVTLSGPEMAQLERRYQGYGDIILGISESLSAAAADPTVQVGELRAERRRAIADRLRLEDRLVDSLMADLPRG